MASVLDAQPPELESFLPDCPAARVTAVTADGTPVPVPADVPLSNHHVLGGTSGMKAYVHADRTNLIDAFDRALRTGYGTTTVHLLDEPGIALETHLFNELNRYGVVLVVGVPTQTTEAASPTLPAAQNIPPRLGRIYKTRTAMILAVDDALTEILGWTAEQMVGRRSLEFIHPDDQGLAIESWAVMLSDPDAVRRARVRHRTSEGQWRWFDVAHTRSSVNGEECFVADMVDVSAEMRTQRALEAREQLLVRLAQALPLGVFQIDSERRFLYTNDRLFEITATAPGSVFMGLLAWIPLEEGARLLEDVSSVLAGDTDELECRVHVRPSRDGERICRFILRRVGSVDGGDLGAVGCVIDITEQSRMQQELEDRANFDPLTRCYNRVTVVSLLEQMVERASASESRPPAVLFIDLDDFKAVNDRYGHHVGDEFLAIIGGRLRAGVRDGAVVGRLGGDEFLVVLPAIDPKAVDAVAQRLSDAVHQEMGLSVGRITPTASFGVAIAGTSQVSADNLVKAADSAMYDAKARRDGTIVTRWEPDLPTDQADSPRTANPAAR